MKKQSRNRKSSTEKEGTNIQVVLRCRGRNAQEIEVNSPVIVEPIVSDRRRDVLIRTTNKVYSFDRVFGPDAKQDEIYQEVAQPILDQVLLGYNCTIFAYGQTGSGKTYTMEGNLSEQTIGANSKAGIIPRAIHKLFETLDYQGAEYSVKVSLIELYNEELRDLLSVGGSGPPLRIYEDHQGSGVVVQNIEETLISNAKDGIRVLQEGTRNRTSAATKCNEKSSRSHCIFTLTVHIKEEVTGGEQVLKVGKLNLVDLAGSENISRSGAENARAREAGMINQSLLTLGRVINQLVDHSPHVPYRESKLTRLLKDSLGGRTKTCIVATVSVAKLSQEEIVSTLDYASRAQNIRNKPEANQRLNPKILLREYEMTIERLKADLTASRTQKGVYLSQETYNMLVDEKQSKSDRVDELSRDVNTLRSSLDERTNELTNMTKLVQDKDSQLHAIKIKLRELDIKLKQQLRSFQEHLGYYTSNVDLTIEQHLMSLNKYTDTMNSLATQGIKNHRELVSNVGNIGKQLQEKIKQENKKAKDQTHRHFMSLESGIQDFRSQLELLGQFYTKDLQEHIEGEEKHLATQQQVVEQLRDDTLPDVTKELESLKQQYETLQSFVEQEYELSQHEDKQTAEIVSQYVAQLISKSSQTRSDRLNEKMGSIREQLNRSGNQLHLFEKQVAWTLSSSLNSHQKRKELVDTFSDKTKRQKEQLAKIQEHISKLGESSIINYQELRKCLKQNEYSTKASCQSLEAELAKGTLSVDKLIASTANPSHDDSDHSSPIVDIKSERFSESPHMSSSLPPPTLPGQSSSLTSPPAAKESEDKKRDVPKPVFLQDISNRQVKRKQDNDNDGLKYPSKRVQLPSSNKRFLSQP